MCGWVKPNDNGFLMCWRESGHEKYAQHADPYTMMAVERGDLSMPERDQADITWVPDWFWKSVIVELMLKTI